MEEDVAEQSPQHEVQERNRLDMSRQPGDLNSPRYAWRVHTSEEEAAKKKSRSRSGFEQQVRNRGTNPPEARLRVIGAFFAQLE